MSWTDEYADYVDYSWRPLWQPLQAHGWTWLPTAGGAPEGYSLLDQDGELQGSGSGTSPRSGRR